MAEKAVETTHLSARTDAEMNESTTVDDVAVSNAVEAEMVEAESSVLEPTAERRSKRPRAASSDKQPARPTRGEPEDSCRACGTTAIASEPTLALLKCASCHGAVHAQCYLPNDLQTPAPLGASWMCDSCQDNDNDAPRGCVFCQQPGDACMRRIETAHWPAEYRVTSSTDGGSAWAHALCALWNPFGSALMNQEAVSSAGTEDQTVDANNETEAEASTTTQTPSRYRPVTTSMANVFRARLELPVPACSFCDRSEGVRVQCRRLNCGRFFHARCAQSSESGHIEVVHSPFPLKHAYCDRHLQSRLDLSGLTTKLASKTMASLVPRDVATKVQAIARRIEAYTSVDAIFVDLVSVLEELCKKGFKNSKTDPPSFSMRHLQALQLVLDHLPQLHNVYDAKTLSKTEADLVQDAEVVHALQKAFHPQRFVRKFAGPLSQFHKCDACHEPFQERQHVFHCTSSEQIHALHWKCTKRKSAAKDSRHGGSGNSKKKAKSVSLVQQGQWKDVKLPKGLPSIGDGVTCSVCRAPVDARGILGGRKEATRMDFEKPTSEFMFGGCFVNEMDPRTAAAAGLRTNRATIATSVQPGVVPMSNGARAASGKTVPRRSTSTVSAIGDSDGETSALLGPPKMDRINVRRTTRWLACLAQVIRLVSAAKKEAKEAKAKKVQEQEQSTSEPQSDAVSTGEPEAEQTVAKFEEGEKTENHSKSDSTPNVDIEMKQASAETTPSSSDAGNGTNAELAEPPMPRESIISAAGELSRTNVDESMSTGIVTTTVAAEEAITPVSPPSSLPATALAYLEEAKNVVRPYDTYALSKMESAHRMFEERNGPALSVLSTLIQEYTRFLYVKHTRAVAKASNEKRKREELEAQEERERERKRIDREAELALKKQMLAMRKKQRT